MNDPYRTRLAGELRSVSVALEHESGAESIPTIEAHYVAADNRSVYACPHAGCPFRRRDAVMMWRHLHFSPAHEGGHIADARPELLDRVDAVLRRYTSPLRAVS